MSNLRRSIKGDEGNWVVMQNDTFKNWVNANLRSRAISIENLETGFEDGVNLIHLFEVASKKSVGRYAKTPKFQNQKLENVSLVLKAMENDGVKLVSIDSDHIVNGNSKMILGLIWQLILRYQIGGTEDKSVKIALKKLLLIWLQHVIPEQRITNLTSDWNSGVALCNLINVLRPGLFPEYNHLDRDAKVVNVAKGMQIAEEHFGIPQIISPDNMASPNVDELSMMTYLSYFTQDNGVGEKWTANLVNGWNSDLKVSNFNTDWNDGRRLGKLVNTFSPGTMPEETSENDVENCRLAMDVAKQRFDIDKIISPDEMANPNIPELAIMAYTVQFTKVQRLEKPADKFQLSGPGLVEPKVGVENEFYVRSEGGYPLDDLQVDVIGPNNNYVPVEYEDPDPELRRYKYRAEEQGNYRINVRYKGDPVPRSPVSVIAHQDLTTVRVHGDGLASSIVHEETEFTVDVGNRNANVTAQIEGPEYSRPIHQVINNGNGTYTVRYRPDVVGTHRIYLNVNGQDLPGGPIETEVNQAQEVTETVAVTSQYEEDTQLYAELNERIGIAVDTSHSGEGTLSAQTVGPDGEHVQSEVDTEGDGNYTVSFTPEKIGEYHTNVYWNGKPIHGSPFVVWVSDPQRVYAHGDSLYQTRYMQESIFEVATNGAGPGHLTAYAECDGVEYPVNVNKRQDDLYDCSFTPRQVGIYYVHVNYNNVPVKNSPFKVKVGNPDCAKVNIIEDDILESNQPQSFTLDFTEGCGQGDVGCVVKGPDGRVVPCEVRDGYGNKKEIIFVPEEPGRYQAFVYYAGAEIMGSPYIFDVGPPRQRVDPSKVLVTVPSSALTQDESRVQIDASNAGPGRLTVQVEGETHDIPADIRDNNNGTYDVTFTPTEPGVYRVSTRWNDEHTPNSPFTVNVEAKAEPEEVMVEGDGIKEGTAGQPVLFTLDGRNAGPGQLSCRCRAPSGKMTYVLISDNKDGTYTVDLNATEPGLHTVEVEWDEQPIPGSPFLVRIMQAPDVKKVRAHGPGLESGVLRNFNGIFQVDSKGAGPGTLKVRIHGPKGAFKVEMSRDNPKDRVINVKYSPTEPGIYTANVFWSDEHIEGSPFQIIIEENEERLRRLKESLDQQRRENINGY